MLTLFLLFFKYVQYKFLSNKIMLLLLASVGQYNDH